jgi:hypothetical protein
MELKKLTPVLIVEAIEPCLPFWEGRLGFKRTMEAPHGSALGFVALQRDAVEVMIQTRASVMDDLPQAEGRGNSAALYIEVKSLADVEKALQGLPILVRRRAPYGAEELFLREPGGHVVGFAQHA